MRSLLLVASLSLAAFTPYGALAQAPSVVVEANAGEHERIDSPVFLDLPEAMREYQAFTLSREDDRRPLAVQRVPGEPPRIAWILDKRLPAGQVRRYRLTALEASDDARPNVRCLNDGKRLTVKIGQRPVLVYNHVIVESPPGLAPHFRRSGHIHPLYNPAGQIVTDDFPPDHAHQHGIFFPWVNTTFEGRKVDFWNQAGGTGAVQHVGFGEVVDGPVFAQFTAVLRHIDLSAPDGPVAVLEERRTVRVYNLPERFLIDIESRQHCAGESPLTINEYHYGGMALRGSRQWFQQPGGDFLTSQGRTRANGNHTRPRWVDAHGLIDGHPAGVTVMCHRDNFRFPQPVRLHPSKPYFCFAPMVLGSFAIQPEQEYISRYRFQPHAGEPDAARSDRLWADFCQPPEIRVVGSGREGGQPR